MLTRLVLERFRGFKSLQIDLRPLTVVAGRNSSGKTSILHATRMAIEALAIGLEEATPYLEDDAWICACRDHIVWDQERLCPVGDWAELFTDKEVLQGSSILVELTFEDADFIQAVKVDFSYAHNDQLKMTVRVRSQSAREEIGELPKRSKFRGQRLSDLLKRNPLKAFFVPAFYGVTRNEEYRSRALVTSLLGGGDQSRIVRNLIARLDGLAFDRLNDFLRRSIGATLITRTTAQDAEDVQHLKVYFQDTNGLLELSSAGAGLINLIALYAAMERFRPTQKEGSVIFLLDEPEAHLHPRLQGDVGEALGAIRAEFGAQLLIATHSVEMINRLGQRPDTLLLAVDRATSSAIELSSEAAVVRELGQWCDLTPFTSLNFLASRRILFHEGKTDAEILTRCAELYFRSDTPKLIRFRAWTLVSLDGVGNAKAQGMLRAVLTPKLFPDLSAKETVRAICVFDRDAERTPGLRVIPALTKNHFEASELVWSRYSIESLFLSPACLGAWVAGLLPSGAIADGATRKLVEEGLALADKDHKLNDAAENSLALAKVRLQEHPDDPSKKVSLSLKDAMQEAKDEVRKHPDVWQQGKGRARVVLMHVRGALPNALQNPIRGTVAGLVEAGSVDKLGDVTILIPDEIRALLDHMAVT